MADAQDNPPTASEWSDGHDLDLTSESIAGLTELDLLSAPAGPEGESSDDTSVTEAGFSDDDFAIFDLGELESQEVWQFKEVSPEDKERGDEAPPAEETAPAEDEPEPPPPPPPVETPAPETGSEPEAAVATETDPVPATGPDADPTPTESAEPTAQPTPDQPPTEPEAAESEDASAEAEAGAVSPNMPSEAMRVLEDLERLGIAGASETLANAAAGKPAAPDQPAPAPPPTATGGVPAGAVSTPSAPAATAPAPAQPAEATSRARTGPRRMPWQAPWVRAVGHVLADVLIAIDRPFARVSPRIKGYVGQVAVSMLVTAACFILLNALGVLPD